jgi:hypothetical protein
VKIYSPDRRNRSVIPTIPYHTTTVFCNLPYCRQAVICSILALIMPQFTKNQVFILPHAQQYRQLYEVSVAEVLQTLNQPDVHEGLAEDHYTAEKTIGTRRIFVYYYVTLPLQGNGEERFAIVDLVSFTSVEDERVLHRHSPKPGGSGNQLKLHEPT